MTDENSIDPITGEPSPVAPTQPTVPQADPVPSQPLQPSPGSVSAPQADSQMPTGLDSPYRDIPGATPPAGSMEAAEVDPGEIKVTRSLPLEGGVTNEQLVTMLLNQGGIIGINAREGRVLTNEPVFELVTEEGKQYIRCVLTFDNGTPDPTIPTESETSAEDKWLREYVSLHINDVTMLALQASALIPE